ncbi:hypothetical protein [Paraburkholderia tagetis]|uniref:Glycosaminoglycan attachment site n=1 Tax=Paraburkholderia tagetis TaxID=2913261 RepID=A0A9X1UPY9_9BURK|nr:hypothetical protein [Paraburkholderia tagetis]MCG5079096.1 hypothetical protein [Paraburkholderia tagetis]
MAIDLFADLGKPDTELHPQYVSLRDTPGYSPARQLLRRLQEDFVDPDGSFVEQFQTFALDARTFEFFLSVMLKDVGHELDRSFDRPDFLITKGGLTAAVEAVTANPKGNGAIQPYDAVPDFKTLQEAAENLAHTIPIRLGSPLFTKLRKKYWELPQVANKPLILAIQDFHAAGALATSDIPLVQYLYGLGHTWWHDESGNLVIQGHQLEEHRQGYKRIPSGFFRQPDGEHISAVLFCNTGTIPKFNRMGHQGEFMAKGVRMLRWGACYRHDPNAAVPQPFVYEVGDKEGPLETWRQGTVLIRNPHALHPLPDNWFGAALEHTLVDGEVRSMPSEFFLPFYSTTNILMNASRGDVKKMAQGIYDSLISVLPP